MALRSSSSVARLAVVLMVVMMAAVPTGAQPPPPAGSLFGYTGYCACVRTGIFGQPGTCTVISRGCLPGRTPICAAILGGNVCTSCSCV
ncbi:hypothetical protein GOP47_0020894 [Adiantum capillus-veneris]|uniref:Uncharacterized protein n=1 Tax=Adiantum capillus-veneris TaxID=13818 RepID=A0A9D4Z7E2_ADICA|nr:hypothetical protein GOP47_0020894 [Adiantum capillus-veneris]